MVRMLCLRALAVVLLPSVAFAQIEFEVEFDVSASVLTTTERDQISSHLREAGRRWLRVIDHVPSATVTIRVHVAAVPTANAGSATTGFVAVVSGRSTYEQGAAFELRTGDDPNGSEHDVNVAIGLSYLRDELWFDPDPVNRIEPVPNNRTDALSVMLHEIGHALAYNGWADLTTGVPPAAYWSTFDRWFQPGAPTVFVGPAAVAAWGTPPDVTTGNNKHWGNPTAFAPWLHRSRTVSQPPTLWRGGVPLPVLGCGLAIGADAPPSAEPHDHLHEGAPSLIDELMNGVVYYRGRRYDISPLDRAVMIDIGLRSDTIFANGFQ